MGKFEIKIDKSGGEAKVAVLGVIDEDADFGPHALTGAQVIDMDLGGIKSINSCGIREWIKWVETASGAVIKYNECPKIIVDQINMVQGFLPKGGAVVSFYVPYYSDESGDEKNVLFKYGQEFDDSGLKNPPSVKAGDGTEMEMDVVEAKYFKFLKK